MKYLVTLFCLYLPALMGQEASAGIDIRATVSGDAAYSHNPTSVTRDGSAAVGALRAVFYPNWKIGEHWVVSAALQVDSTPYFQGDVATQRYGLEARVLQANIGYSKTWNQASILIRGGQLLSAFGSFLLRYDDAVNPLISSPTQYGYYYAPVTTGAMTGVQADISVRNWDGRLQFTNSSPANPRSPVSQDQYPNWTAGTGYTIRQGFRIGASAYRGPYLDRDYDYFFPGESRPRDLPATGLGLDAEFAHGHWNLYGEMQHFRLTYHAIPTYIEDAGYVEIKRVLHPRWYLATRIGYDRNNYATGQTTCEVALGFRPNGFQLIKAGYTIAKERDHGNVYSAIGVQLVTTLHPLSKAWR